MQLQSMRILGSQNWSSAISGQSVIRPSASSSVRSLAAALTLTSLVDCFTILVVYLLVATSFGSEELSIPKDMLLPKAAHSIGLSLDKGLIVKVANGQFFINDKVIHIENLAQTLQSHRADAESMLIQADKKTDYAKLNPAVLAGLQAGFKKIKFAVLQEDN